MGKIALYIRLSVEDQIKKDESESIINQRSYLNDYLDRNDEFKGFPREEFIDDGYSGTNEKRPAFQRMLEEVKAGQVKIIIVKDLSRFMRDYIVLGDYLENIFPFMGIRFIAINDGYDSAKEKGNGTDLDVQFKGLLYDFYSKDIAQKVKSVTTELKKQGKYLAWSPPLGYMKDPNDKHKIIIDKETAWIVRKVYDLALDGLSTRKIAAIMNEENIPTPQKRKKEITNLDYDYMITFSETRDEPTWTNGTVTDILSNENYTGTYVFNMQEKSMTRPGSFKFNPKEEWERVYNHHEAIVTKEEFDKVQRIKESNQFLKGKNTDYPWRTKSPLQGYARCPTCNHILGLQQSKRVRKDGSVKVFKYFSCRICKCNNVLHKNSKVERLEEQVLSLIKEKYGEIETRQEIKDNPKDLEKKIEKLQDKKMSDFEKYKLGKITKAKFIENKAKVDKMINELEEKLKTSSEQKEVVTDTELTRELMDKYVESVLCENSIVQKIIWK